MADKPKRIRLSLETTESVKQEFLRHAADLGEWSMIGMLRRAVSRSAAIHRLSESGALWVIDSEDGDPVPWEENISKKD